MSEISHEEKIKFMRDWCNKNGLELDLKGACGFGRECVGVIAEGTFPDYTWEDDNWNRIDGNGEVWTPEDAYHKHNCVAVLGRGVNAESQLYEWIKWFSDNNFKLEVGDIERDKSIDPFIWDLMGMGKYVRLVKS